MNMKPTEVGSSIGASGSSSYSKGVKALSTTTGVANKSFGKSASRPVAAADNTTATNKSNKTSLLARLHQLISTLNEATNAVKNWPSSHDDQVHYDATTNLIQSLHKVVDALKEVEDRACNDSGSANNTSVGQSILDAPVVLDLLDLMDYGNGLNPEIFIKQLIREALRQLSGLKRRKQALEMLGQAIENGLKDMELKESLEQQLADVARHYSTGEKPAKRLREEGGTESEDAVTDTSEPPVKKVAL
jgi:hypothetical protein